MQIAKEQHKESIVDYKTFMAESFFTMQRKNNNIKKNQKEKQKQKDGTHALNDDHKQLKNKSKSK